MFTVDRCAYCSAFRRFLRRDEEWNVKGRDVRRLPKILMQTLSTMAIYVTSCQMNVISARNVKLGITRGVLGSLSNNVWFLDEDYRFVNFVVVIPENGWKGATMCVSVLVDWNFWTSSRKRMKIIHGCLKDVATMEIVSVINGFKTQMTIDSILNLRNDNGYNLKKV